MTGTTMVASPSTNTAMGMPRLAEFTWEAAWAPIRVVAASRRSTQRATAA